MVSDLVLGVRMLLTIDIEEHVQVGDHLCENGIQTRKHSAIGSLQYHPP